VSQHMPLELQEAQVHRVAGQLTYPPTPDIAAAIRQRLESEQGHARRRLTLPAPIARASRRKLAWVALTAMLALLLVGVLAVPEVRAVVQSLLRIGSIKIVAATPTPPGAPTPTPQASNGISAHDGINLAGGTTLQGAQQQVYFPIRVPAYPPDLGAPDGVYLQNLDGDMVILMWLQPGWKDRPRMALYELTSNVYGRKSIGDNARLQETTVHGQQAAWVSGSHTLDLYDNTGRPILQRRLDDANVLLWIEGGITYRLETTLPLEEAVKVAESLGAASITPGPSPSPLSLLDLAGETTLEAAKQDALFVQLPSYPRGLGKPDKVFSQDLGDPAVILAWTQPGHPEQARLALYEMVSATISEQTANQTTVLKETRVHGNVARWVRGPHELAFQSQYGVKLKPARLVEGNALHWYNGAITYRLETTLPVEDAIKIAESVP
jgi:hypothetical protein